MIDIKSVDVDKNLVVFEDFDEVTPEKFQLRFTKYFEGFVAGETLNPFDMERFMKRSSSKNMEHLIGGKKMEGFLEASLGKKLDANWLKMILILVVVGVIATVAVLALRSLKIF